jgi:hypothetical protein
VSGTSALSRLADTRDRWNRYLAAAADGLPRYGVLLWPMAAVLLALATLAVLGVTGSSSGILWPVFSDGPDPAAIAGEPRAIRSDEWYVQTVWTVSQVQLGLPIINPVLPGGMDTTIQHDLPSGDWSVIFRPNLVGFWALPFDAAMSLRWWLPPAVLICAAYAFFLTMMRERPIAAMALAVCFYLSPFVQWWHISPTTFAPAWAFALMTACLWLVRGARPLAGLVMAIVVGYLTITVGMLIYVPFILPCALVALIFCAGILATRTEIGFRGRMLRIWPLAAAGLAACLVLATWLLTHLPAVQQFLGTRYPGQRIQRTGAGTTADLASLLGGPFSTGMEEVGGGVFGVNASESSTFLLVGLFLAVPITWGWIRTIRRHGWRGSDWIAASTLAALVLFLAFYFIPGWDAIARLLFLDRTTVPRIRIGIGLLSFVMVAVFLGRTVPQLSPRSRFPWQVTVGSIAIMLLAYSWLVRRLLVAGSPILLVDREWMVAVGAFILAVVALLLVRPTLGVAALLVASIVVGIGVNPLRAGVFDLRDTTVADAAYELQEEAPGRWIAMGDPAIALLTETGLPALSGYQSSPSPEMWRMIDPESRYRDAWDRLGLVAWTPESGDTKVLSPGVDVVVATFDSCNAVAQEHIRYVIAVGELDQPCLRLARTIQDGDATFNFYEVLPTP